ncbi:MAG: methionyl-tRNA formyltransferase [Chitinispirillaceae bacterium]
MNIVFMGSADFGIPALQSIKDSDHTVVGVVSTPAKPQGRGRRLQESPVTRYARQQKLGPIYTPDRLKNPEFISTMQGLNADIYVVVAFRILPFELFSIPPCGTVNIHASLLPRYRGPAPIQRAIEAGERTTGVTIFQIDAGVDTGKIILQRSTDIGQDETTPELYQKLSTLGAEGILEALECIQNHTCMPVEQDSSGATRAPKLSKDEAVIDWAMPARLIYNRIRAFKPFPGTVTRINGRRLGIEWASVSHKQYEDVPGTLVQIEPDSFTVACGEGSLKILQVKPEGKKTMDVGAFLRGNAMEKGLVLR